MGDQGKDVDRPGLADAVGAGGGLVLGGGVPPGVVMDHHVRPGQVEAGAARLEGNQEDAALARVEPFGQVLAFLGGGVAVQVQGLNALPAQPLFQQAQHRRELGKQQDPPVLLDGLGHQVHQHVFLAGPAQVALHAQGGMAAYLPQLHDRREDLRPPPVHSLRTQDVVHPRAALVEDGVVDLLLLLRQFAVHRVLHQRGKLVQHVLPQAAHQEGTDAGPQVVPAVAVLVALEEAGVGGQIAGQAEIHQRPQLARVVLHRRAGQGQAGPRLQFLDGPGGDGLGVFDLLRLVQDDEVEGDTGQLVDVPPDQRIAGDQGVRRVRGGLAEQDLALGLAALHQGDGKLRGKAAELVDPVVHQRPGGDDQAGQAVRQVVHPFDRRDGLDGFAQAHVVGQDAAHVQGVQGHDPVVSPHLVGPQGGKAKLGDGGLQGGGLRHFF